MQRLGDLSVRKKLMLLMSLFVMGFVIFTVVGLNTLEELKVNGPIYRHIVEGKDLAADVLPPPLFVVAGNVAVLEALSQPNPADQRLRLQELQKVRRDFEDRAAWWKDRLPDGPIRDIFFERVIPSGREYLETAERQLMPLILAGEVQKAKAMHEGTLVPMMKKHRQYVDQVTIMIESQIKRVEAEAVEAAASRVRFLMIIAGAAVIIVFSLGFIIVAAIVGPLGRLSHTMSLLASTWDLTLRVPVEGKDEVSKACAAFNEVAKKLQQSLTTVSAATMSLAAASEELSTNAEQMASGSKQQSEQAVQASTGAEEMSATAAHMSQSAQGVATQAQSAVTAAMQGNEIVTHSVTSMSHLGETIRMSAEHIHQLGERSEQIGQIVRIIEEIADQTNLLALNAAIEAARAGEQGRGFAVVADEVRKLAERTTKATREISETIRTIQDDTGQAVTAMKRATDETQSGIELAQAAGQRLNDIVASVKVVTGMIEQIVGSIDEQSTAAQHIAHNIEGLAQVVRRNEGGLGQISEATGSLARMSSDLQRVVSGFRLA
ncbi:MAG TPA: methyl-accepting chemotaxis protein [Nitrospiraceae bacterium]|nr:methyl-accepting chemotaxis protein [Nitrospiraceae bacterium]